MSQIKLLYLRIPTSTSVLTYSPPLQMEDPSEIMRRLGTGELLYLNSLELMHQYTFTHLKRITVGRHRWCILTLSGMHSGLLMAKDAFTANEELAINVGLMTAVLVYRGLDD